MLSRVRNLFRQLTIYGIGDVSTSLVSLLLLPVFTNYLSPEEYGVLNLLLVVEAVTKIAFRWGVDTAFMRMYYDCPDHAARQRLASTIFFFLLAANGSLTIVAALGSSWLAGVVIDAPGNGYLVALTILNTFIAGFYFIPYQSLRIAERSTQYLALTFTRTALTIVARLALVIGAGLGVFGVVLSDVAVTAVFTLLMIGWFAPLIRPMFSRRVLADCLAFGLPRVPHSVAQQVISVSDRMFLRKFATLADVGIYGVASSFGLALKLFLSAFESAWTPFFLGAMREPNAKETYRVVSTYVVAVLVLLVAGTCALAPGLVTLFTAHRFQSAAQFEFAPQVTTWIALSVACQGLYLIGSIGLVITKRTWFYPVATGIAAAVNVIANFVLIPRWGMRGAAWATVAAYAVLAVVTTAFSRHVYPIGYEWKRLSRIVAAGAAAYVTAILVVPQAWPTALQMFARGSVVVVTNGLALAALGFFHAGEWRRLRDLGARLRRVRVAAVPAPPADVEMAGEIVAGPTEVAVEIPRRDEPVPTVDSRDPRR